MASSKAAGYTTRKLYQTYPALRREVNKVQQEIFGYFPNLGVRTGHQKTKKSLQGVYLNRYYDEPIDKYARKAHPEGFMTELQERRHVKREFMRRKGKGPPKKGSGKRSKK
ncbi:expressed unknown protein [Seminavis robusta]|uniref:Mitochondrial ribosomal protein S33 n=1 Tax=Seminavis robusta TaxID=568900 RepID=A0A9N8F5M8_9STRA|nr:expressed unknown protein [Seminavis robusta]CAB9531419.1 expressed unknown protein [Seminavis robusta]|eukprot:Sro2315_g322990.1 n/a (111) ;mRNA; f:13132-13626